MPFRDHTLDRGCVVVDVVIVLAIDEEGRLLVIRLQQVQERLGVNRWAIVKGQCHDTSDRTLLNDGADSQSLLKRTLSGMRVGDRKRCQEQ